MDMQHVGMEYIKQKLTASYKREVSMSVKSRERQFDIAKRCIADAKDLSTNKAINLNEGLPMALVLQGDLPSSWTAVYMTGKDWHWPKEDYICLAKVEEHPVGWDVNAYWNQLLHQPDFTGEQRLQWWEDAKKNKEKVPLEIPQPPFKPDDPAYNQTKIREACTVIGSSRVYDYRPEARHSEVPGETDQYYVTPAGWLDASFLVRLFMRLEMYPEAWECLVRMQHGVSWGEPPSDLIGHPRLKHMAAWTNLFWHWYLARQAADPQRRQEHAWSAVYWLIEYHLRVRNTDFHRDEFEIFCELLAEFRLLGERHEEFLSHFQIKAMYASISHLRATLERPVKMVPFPERGVPTIAEAKRIYDELYPPDASRSK